MLETGICRFNMYMSPSSIHFTNCTGQTAIQDLTKETDLERLTSTFEEKGTLPKIQVAKKDGHYFSLNNIQLQVFRKLEEKGHCQNVKVEVIAIKRVPEAIRDMMTVPTNTEGDRGGYSTESHRLKRRASCNDDNDEDEDDTSLESCSVASSSDSETSDDNDGNDESAESSTDASTEEELEEERESLL